MFTGGRIKVLINLDLERYVSNYVLIFMHSVITFSMNTIFAPVKNQK